MTLSRSSVVKLPAQAKPALVRLSAAGLTVGTPVMTSTGKRPIEELKSGDRVLTKDLGMQVVKCIAFRDADLESSPDLSPIRVPPGAFGHERPGQDIYLAPSQQIALRHRMFDVLFASREVLVAARDLVGVAGIERVSGLRGVTYVSLGFMKRHLLYCGNLALDLGPGCQTTTRPALSVEEARLATNLLRPHVPSHAQAAAFPLH
ncbi:Hint domain-containing protein [Litoreibacter ponti]|uniref:Hint domain-containing protein n=1 Tax=Litoreibacter ponti TaxID=1510457 RepID=A0A2T6BP21_9RHOB|nr:Hint domain-containing protein [Litoreibacter ponti]PTX57828.1 Hint domain-containing protein [Litoreibacter ponti]